MLKTISAVSIVTALLISASQTASANWWDDSIRASKTQRGELAPQGPRLRLPSQATRAAATTPRPVRTASLGDTPVPSAMPSLSGSGGQVGIASFYWQPQRVASGGWFNPDALTAAHRTLRFGTRVRVTRLDNGSSVVVVINDRGPFISGRIIDLSRRAAQVIGMTGQGLARVRVDIVG